MGYWVSILRFAWLSYEDGEQGIKIHVILLTYKLEAIALNDPPLIKAANMLCD